MNALDTHTVAKLLVLPKLKNPLQPTQYMRIGHAHESEGKDASDDRHAHSRAPASANIAARAREAFWGFAKRERA